MAKLAVAALAGAMTLATASTAGAVAMISIGTSLNGGAIVTRAQGAVSPGQMVDFAPSGGMVLGNFDVTHVGATFGLAPALLGGDTLTIKPVGAGASGTLDIYITLSSLDPSVLAGGATLISSFSASRSPAGTVLSTYFNANNAVYGTSNLLQTLSLPSGGVGDFSAGPMQAITPPASDFSVTERFHILPGKFNGDIDLGMPAVPEPATWAMMIVGLGGAGLLIRARRRILANAPA